MTVSKTHIVKKVEVACEYLASKNVGILLHEAGYDVNVNEVVNDYTEYIKYIYKTILPKTKDQKTFESEMEIRKPLVKGTSDSILEQVMINHGDVSHIQIINSARELNGDGVKNKADISIVIDYDIRNALSVKQYMTLGDIQVASGTYMSTLCGLSFPVKGRGSFLGPLGKFQSKDCLHGKDCYCNYNVIKDNFIVEYGEEIIPHLNMIWGMKKDIAEASSYTMYPGEKWWTEFCYKIGMRGIDPMYEALKIVQNKDRVKFKKGLLERLALSDATEGIIISGFNKKMAFTFNSNIDKPLKELVNKLTNSNTDLVMKKHHKGLRGVFTDGVEEILVVTIPLTVSKNGSWVGAKNGRICSLDKKFYNFNELRPKKAVSMDTSTNCWLKMKSIFDDCLRLRPQNGVIKLTS